MFQALCSNADATERFKSLKGLLLVGKDRNLLQIIVDNKVLSVKVDSISDVMGISRTPDIM